MFRPASRSILRAAQGSLAPPRTRVANRFLGTAPPAQKRRSWKSSAARWGLAIAGIYFYNTSELFAEEPVQYNLDPKADYDDSNTPSLDAITEPSREKKIQPSTVATLDSNDNLPPEDAVSSSSQPQTEHTSTSMASDPGGLEEEASSEGAFNPATGEINWDCPCLGGMAHGPCGEEFRAAFSCFVFSEEEPKGMNCIDHFKEMQTCFRAHPDIYAAELEGDDDETLDEGLEEERKELVKEIKERRETVAETAAESVQGKRLLEEDPPTERKPLLRRSERPTASPSSISSPPSSEPHSKMSEDHKEDAGVREQPLPTKRQPESNPDKASKDEGSDEELKLKPKEWHDSRSGSNSDTKTEK